MTDCTEAELCDDDALMATKAEAISHNPDTDNEFPFQAAFLMRSYRWKEWRSVSHSLQKQGLPRS